jgi:potassium-transporting ATPase potassium-binding subunit
MLSSILTIILIVGGTALLSWPLGKYMAVLFSGRFARADRLFTAATGGAGEQDWKQYSLALAAFNVVMFGFVFALLATQHLLPFNPDGQGAAGLDLVFNTAASFTTNTNLQHYSGESTWSYLAQLVGLMWLQFVSAATGIAALAALARGIGGQASMGNFFLDVQRAAFCVLR